MLTAHYFHHHWHRVQVPHYTFTLHSRHTSAAHPPLSIFPWKRMHRLYLYCLFASVSSTHQRYCEHQFIKTLLPKWAVVKLKMKIRFDEKLHCWTGDECGRNLISTTELFQTGISTAQHADMFTRHDEMMRRLWWWWGLTWIEFGMKLTLDLWWCV